MQTVVELFRALEKRRLTYAVLRNYEHFPDLRVSAEESNTDIDLVVAASQLPELRAVLASLARDLQWDALTECRHFTQSREGHHHIEIFRFYRLQPFEFLQVDVFHGFLLLGLPLMDEDMMLAGRVHDAARGVTHIDPIKGNLFRLLQIHGLRGDERTAKKQARYRGKAVAQLRVRGPEILEAVRRTFAGFGLQAIRALETGDAQGFHRAMRLGRLLFFGKYALRHPLRAARSVVARVRDDRARFHTNHCGFALSVYTDGEQARHAFETAMNSLQRWNVVDAWMEKRSSAGNFSSSERHVLEQGGLLAVYTTREKADVVVADGEPVDTIIAGILAQCIDRHDALYLRPGWRLRDSGQNLSVMKA